MMKYFVLIGMVVFIIVSTNNQVIAQNYTAQQMYEKANQCFDNNDLTNAEYWLKKSADKGHDKAKKDLLSYKLYGTTSHYNPSEQDKVDNVIQAGNDYSDYLYQKQVELIEYSDKLWINTADKKKLFSMGESEYSAYLKSTEKKYKDLYLKYALKHFRASAQKGYKKAQKKLRELGY